MKKISYIALIDVVLYGLFVSLFLITKSKAILTVWELLTIISGFIMLFLFIKLEEYFKIKEINKKLLLCFLTSLVILTTLAHSINIFLTERLIEQGKNVPTYFQIGYFPSTEMITDYLAWGLFMGLSFFCFVGFKNKNNKIFNYLFLICGILCFLGFFGSFVINENLWYFAPIAYSLGISIIIILVLIREKKKNEN